MANAIFSIFILMVSVMAVPFVVYFSVKFGRYGYLKANDLHAEESKETQDESP
jgi:hypothetical protein